VTRSSKRRRNRQRAKASAPRVIVTANDDAPYIANDNAQADVGGILLTTDQTRRLRLAEENAASNDHQRKVAGRAALVQLEAEIEAAKARARQAADLVETTALEAARGSAVEVSNDPKSRGRIEVRNRDGLTTAATGRSDAKGRLITPPVIDTIQHAAALRYRVDYEHLNPGRALTPPDPEGARKIVRGGDGWAQRLKDIGDRVRRIDLMICGIDPDADRPMIPSHLPQSHRYRRAMIVIRMVAGEGVSLNAIAKAGAVRERWASALRHALDQAAIVYGLD
jgi:hypothetical protein